jgi:hypothetical protein
MKTPIMSFNSKSVFRMNPPTWALAMPFLAVLFLLYSQTATAQLAPEPTVQASGVNFANVSSTGMTINWTAGDGTYHLVFVKKGAGVDAFPLDATSNSASTTFGNGTQLGTGNFVVYTNTGTSVTITNLSTGWSYGVGVCEFNGQGFAQNYLTNPVPAMASQTTPFVAPTIDSAGVGFSTVLDVSMNVGWFSGNGEKRIVVAKAGSAPTGTPTDGTAYNANPGYSLGDALGNGYVVFNGTGSSFVVTNLSAATTYYFKIFEYNTNSSGSTMYYTSGSPATGSQSTTTPVFYWLTNSIGNWSAGSSWVGGNVPGSANSVWVLNTNAPFTITEDITTNIQDLVYDWAPITGTSGSETTLTTAINPGQTLSVLGPNGFLIEHNPGWKGGSIYTFTGTALVVSNLTARFTLNSGQTAGGASSKWNTMNFSAVTNLTAVVNFFGGANVRLGTGGASIGDQSVQATLARTNVIYAYHTDDYSQLDFTNSIEISRNDNSGVAGNGYSQNSFFDLGRSNGIYAESIGIGRGASVGSGLSLGSVTTGNAGTRNINGFTVGFANTNSGAPPSSAYFRNTDGVSRMKLLALGVDSGTTTTNQRNCGNLNLFGGKVDMMVEQIWMGRNRTNSTLIENGGFAFDNGTVDANVIIAGYEQFTNISPCAGYLVIGANGILKVNNYLALGYTATNDPTGAFITGESQSLGQIQINNGGVANINRIILGPLSTAANSVTINGGGSLVLSNTIADGTKSLNTLTMASGGSMTLALAAGVTNVFTTNLTTSGAGPWTINIASAPPGASTNVLIYYNNGGIPGAHTFSFTLPPGFNNGAISDDGHNITLIISTNAPKNLAWRGYQNSNWDNSTPNWLDLNSLTATKYTDGDIANFDDMTNIPTAITVTMGVIPSQVGNGITFTNSTNSFTFTASGGGNIGPISLVKDGTASFTLNMPSTLNANIVNGLFQLGAAGTVNGVTVRSAATFTNAGNVASTVTSQGTTLNTGKFNTWSIGSGAVAVNGSAGLVGGTLSLGSNARLYNYGGFTNIGSPTTAAGSFIYNPGYLAGTALSIGGTLEDPGTGQYPPQWDNYSIASSIAVGTLTINGSGVFIVGGGTANPSGVANVTVTEFPIGTASPAGKVQFNTGSTNIFTINLDSSAVSQLWSPSLGLGANQSNPLFNGSTLVITNIGATQLANGMSLQLFVNVNSPSSPVANTGQNTTNSFVAVVPAAPGVGLAWDISHVASDGIISVINRSSLNFTLTNSIVHGFTAAGQPNVVWSFSWPPGGYLQIQNSTLTAGLVTNWATVAGTYVTNNTHSITISNNVNADTAVFYRYIYPAQ